METKVFISCKNDCLYPQDKVLQPIQIGAAIATEKLAMQQDNLGENISEKLERYQAITTQYWAFKNTKFDSIGFFNSDKYFNFLPQNSGKKAKNLGGGL